MNTRWISMLNLPKKKLAKCKTLLLKMDMDSVVNHQAKFNYEHMCDLQNFLCFAYIFPSLENLDVFIKFAQMQDGFIYDLVVNVKVCQRDVYNKYVD
jgi:hypothetical protein